jgi:DNA-directed RNA polymerase specialized sigma24 family protein
MDAGSERAFEDFVEDRMMALFGTAYLLVGDVHQAEDLLQSALEKAYRRWRRIATMEYPEAHVRRVIVNLANDRWRRRRRTTEVALDEAEGASRPRRSG